MDVQGSQCLNNYCREFMSSFVASDQRVPLQVCDPSLVIIIGLMRVS